MFMMKEAAKNPHEYKRKVRLTMLAQTAYEEAAMWAVKAANILNLNSSQPGGSNLKNRLGNHKTKKHMENILPVINTNYCKQK
jgi:hypothetical protein